MFGDLCFSDAGIPGTLHISRFREALKVGVTVDLQEIINGSAALQPTLHTGTGNYQRFAQETEAGTWHYGRKFTREFGNTSVSPRKLKRQRGTRAPSLIHSWTTA